MNAARVHHIEGRKRRQQSEAAGWLIRAALGNPIPLLSFPAVSLFGIQELLVFFMCEHNERNRK